MTDRDPLEYLIELAKIQNLKAPYWTPSGRYIYEPGEQYNKIKEAINALGKKYPKVDLNVVWSFWYKERVVDIDKLIEDY